MFPPSQQSPVDLAALAGICGSISIACWVVVFSPQIIENFRRSSSEGLSIAFLLIWLLGDAFNIIGAVLQGVLPTMTILAIYYTLADIVLVLQCFYYRGFTLSDYVAPEDGHIQPQNDAERRPLLDARESTTLPPRNESEPLSERRSSFARLREHLGHVDGTHLSPATPLHDVPKKDPPAVRNMKPNSVIQTVIFNTVAILLVCAAGAFGWFLSTYTGYHKNRNHHTEQKPERLTFDTWGQIFGWLCAILYLGSRVPQLLLNWRRKSTEGISLLFFLFACIGNLTYDMSIFAYDPTPLCVGRGIGKCGSGEGNRIYAKYIAVNASWIAGSLGTLLLDLGIFIQFFMYRKEEGDVDVAVLEDEM